MAYRDYTEGPLKMLTDSVMDQNKVLIDIGNQYHGNSRRIIANIVGYDDNFNMVLRNITEMWYEYCDRTQKWVQKERYLAKICLPGHNVRIIAKL